MAGPDSQPSISPAAAVTLLVLDVDGVMTDGGVRIDDRGIETKRFHVRDGTGIRVWIELGCDIAIITGRSGAAVRHRAAELGIRHVIQGAKRKGPLLDELLARLTIMPEQVAMLGDDLPDLPLMQRAAYPMAVADAVREVRSVARYITTRPGGHGAVREAIEHLLTARGRWHEAMSVFA